jgi:acetyl-CoA acyltransferase
MSNLREAFICEGLRTPIGRYGGALASLRPDDLLATVIQRLLEACPGLPADEIDEVIVGCANQAGEDNRNIARMSLLLAGLPVTVPGTTINRLCGSGLDAVATAARLVRTGDAEVVVAGGVESMSRAPFVMPKAATAFSRAVEIHDTTIGWRFVNPRMQAELGVDSMPETAENVAAEQGISREDQDRFALRSQQRALAAHASGRLAREMTSINVDGGRGKTTTVSEDEHPRETSLEKLAALKAPFRPGGTVTAGNASGVNDGAATVIIASADAVARFNLVPKARVLGSATAGVPPRVMGMGPVPATRKLLDRLDLSISDFDHIELNEAFAAQALACMRELGLADDDPRVNPNGGAIALGHPLGMSGTRLALTAATELSLTDNQRALCTMCIGVGQGIALAMERA